MPCLIRIYLDLPQIDNNFSALGEEFAYTKGKYQVRVQDIDLPPRGILGRWDIPPAALLGCSRHRQG